MLLALDTSLITFIVIIALSALSSWVQSRNKKKEEEAEWGGWDDTTTREQPAPEHTPTRPQKPASPMTAPRPTATSWEEELRRMLGEAPAQPPPRTPQPPPVVVVKPTPPPLPAPTYTAPPRPEPVFTEPAPVYRETNYEAEEVVVAPRRGGQLTEASIAHERASRLHETVTEQLRQARIQSAKNIVAVVHINHREPSPDAIAVVRMMRDPKTVRQAIIASMILNPPKALES